MRVIFCGSGEFAVPCLRAILATAHQVTRIVTQPARPAGRGGKLRHTPVSQVAGELGLAVCQCGDINAPDAVEMLRGCEAQAMVVVDFGQFVREPARRAASVSCFNLHASLLPELRGAAPINWAIIRGHRRTGVTTFELVDRMDAGPIYLQEATEIRPDETAEELKARLAAAGSELVCRTLGLLAGGWAQATMQDESAASRAPRMAKADGVIDWRRSAVEIRNLIHGTWPWPGGQALYRRHCGHLVEVTIARAAALEGPGQGECGCVGHDLSVNTGEGRLEILEIKPAGKRLMQWRDFVNGYRVGPGDCFARVVSS